MIGQLLPAAKRVLAGFGRFSPGQKAATICTVLLLAVGGFLFANWAGKPAMAPLYSNLDSTDAGAIVEKLNANGTQYTLADGGQTIMVSRDQVYDLRLTMSGEGLPAGKDTGYALLDKQGVTTSEFMQQVGYQRALEGELSTTIEAIDGVQNATVHLAVPQKDVFTDEASKPTASVLVATSPGQELSTSQVQAVVHLVSSSIVDLEPAQVTVADAAGHILSAGGEEALDTVGSTRSQQTQQFEQRMSGSLQRMVDQVVGPGHAVVKVTADLDFDQTDTKSQTYVADPKVPPLSESKSSETYTGSGNPSGGVLGPDNVQVPANGGTGSNGTYEQTTETKDNAVGVVTQTRKSAPGAVRRLAVAVLLDSRTAKDVNATAVQTLVSSAVGLDAKRGDTVAVTALPFDQSAAEAAKQAAQQEAAAAKRTALIGQAKTGAMVLAVLLLLFGAWRGSRRRRKTELTAEERAQLEEMQAALEQSRARALEGGGAAALAAGEPAEPARDERAERRSEIAELVERQPAEVAQLLRGWLADRRG